MGLRLVAPSKRKDSGKGQFVQRIPTDLADRLVGMQLAIPVGGEEAAALITITPQMQAIRFSLRTSDPGEIKKRQATAVAYLETLYANLRAARPVSLSHKQCVALSRKLYAAWSADFEATSSLTVDSEAGDLGDDLDAELLEVRALAYEQQAGRMAELGEADLEQLGPVADRVLLGEGIAVLDAASRRMLLGEFARAIADGFTVRSRKAGGDYGPDPKSERFPEWTPPATAKAAHPIPAVSLRGLFDSWWKEAERGGRSVSTKASYETALEALKAFLGHDDAARVSADDMVRFKDHLIGSPSGRTGKPLNVKTVKGSYLTGLNSVFDWAVTNRKLPANPVKGITVKAPRIKQTRPKSFTPPERAALLAQASAAKRGHKEPVERFAGRRWVPWLCAYTGARVGEMAQLRKEDLRRVGDIWVLTITPEAVTVKGGKRRDVPLHPHLVRMGFPEFVAAAPAGPLFMWSGDGRAAWRTAKNRLTEEARKVVPDRRVAPNHGWRHTFKTIAWQAGIADRVVDAICGHAARTVGNAYGETTVVEMADALGRFPEWGA